MARLAATVAALARMVRLSHSLFALPFVAAAVVLVARDATARRPPARAGRRRGGRGPDGGHGDEPDRRSEVRRAEPAHLEPRAGDRGGLPGGRVGAPRRLLRRLRPLRGAPLAARRLALAAVLAVLLGYSFAKRFTWACHLWLGAAQMLAPIGVAIALTGGPTIPSIVLGIGVGAWIAGFDLFWALQDVDFDRGAGLNSIPVRFGERGALRWARGLHTIAAVGVAAAGPLAGRGWGWWAGSAILAAVLLLEHRHVAPGGALRRDRLNVAFFDYNAFASMAFAVCALGDLWVG